MVDIYDDLEFAPTNGSRTVTDTLGRASVLDNQKQTIEVYTEGVGRVASGSENAFSSV